MFIEKQKIRKIIFMVFSMLVMTVSIGLIDCIWLTLKEIEYVGNDLNLHVIIEPCNNAVNVFKNNPFWFCVKLIFAFIAGGLISDKIFIKLGVI
jgi:ABC-type methionine transport system permease subunit